MQTTKSNSLVQAYACEASQVLILCESRVDGLTSDEAALRLKRDGANRLPEGKKQSSFVRFIKHFDDILIYILLAAAALKAAMRDWVDFGVILAVALINAAIGFIQEGRAERALDGIRSMLSAQAQVRRDGEWTHIDAENLVVGDVIRMGPGARVPADVRLLEAHNLRVEEAALTGEAVPSTKGAAPVEPDTGIGDRSSMLFSSSLVAAGSGIGVVVAVGVDAEIGRITMMLSQIDKFDTPLTKQIAKFGHFLAMLIAGMVVVMALIGSLGHQMPFSDLVSATIGFAVAAIPEGLPALVTITLALGVQQMAKRHAIIRRLPAVETLGAVTVICSDKTGTLTSNEMTARRVITADATYEVAGLGYAPIGDLSLDEEPIDASSRHDLTLLLNAADSAVDAVVMESPEGGWTL
ncbi:MAG: HAD-IC family P-type ATPase, partial [Propionibacteriaceae bacterium]|nr:HAD-IC family P-type ATPase [Propionibacteriaceae bacterium]